MHELAYQNGVNQKSFYKCNSSDFTKKGSGDGNEGIKEKVKIHWSTQNRIFFHPCWVELLFKFGQEMLPRQNLLFNFSLAFAFICL